MEASLVVLNIAFVQFLFRFFACVALLYLCTAFVPFFVPAPTEFIYLYIPL